MVDRGELDDGQIRDQVIPRLRAVLSRTGGAIGGMTLNGDAEELYVLIQAIAADVVRQIVALAEQHEARQEEPQDTRRRDDA